MKAVRLTGHGGPEKLEYREDVPTPEPDEGEVLVKVGAAGVNNTDIWTREGAYGSEDDPEEAGGWRRGETMEFPRIQGLDIVGRIVAVGEGVPDFRVGERVLVDFAIYAEEESLADAEIIGSERDGGFAEYVAVPAENAHEVNTSPTSSPSTATNAPSPPDFENDEDLERIKHLVAVANVLLETGRRGSRGGARIFGYGGIKRREPGRGSTAPWSSFGPGARTKTAPATTSSFKLGRES